MELYKDVKEMNDFECNLDREMAGRLPSEVLSFPLSLCVAQIQRLALPRPEVPATWFTTERRDAPSMTGMWDCTNGL